MRYWYNQTGISVVDTMGSGFLMKAKNSQLTINYCCINPMHNSSPWEVEMVKMYLQNKNTKTIRVKVLIG